MGSRTTVRQVKQHRRRALDQHRAAAQEKQPKGCCAPFIVITSYCDGAQPSHRRTERTCSAGSNSDSPISYEEGPSVGTQVGSGVSAGPYKPVPPPRPLGASPAVRGPGGPYVSPPAPSPSFHTHSAKFPIEREVIVTNCDKSSKTPVALQQHQHHQNQQQQQQQQQQPLYRRTTAVAPEALRAAWTVPQAMQNQQSTTADGFRQAGPSRNCLPQEPNNSAVASPPVPLKQTFIYGTRADCKYDEAGNDKEGLKESKTSKTMTKTYHTLKDMISSRFKGKDANDSESKNDPEIGLNNVTDELRKSMREQQEVNNSRKDQGIYGRPVVPQQYGRHLVQMHPVQYQSAGQQQQQQQYLQQQILLNQQQQQHLLGHGPSASSTPQHAPGGLVQARSQELLSRQNVMAETPARPHSQMLQQLSTADNIYYQPQYAGAGQQQRGVVNRTVNYQPEMQQNSNYSGLKQTANNNQMEPTDNRAADLRSPQQLEREILRQRGFVEGRRTASQPQLPVDEDQNEQRFERADPSAIQSTSKAAAPPMRRGSHGNLIESLSRVPNGASEHEKDSDDGGFRSRLVAQGRSFDSKDRPGTSSALQYNGSQLQMSKSELNASENIYSGMKQSAAIFNGLPQTQRQIDMNEDGGSTNVIKKINPGSTASSDYDKNGGPSSNVDSGRGSAAYSSGRRMGHDTSTESDPIPVSARTNIQNSEHNPSTSKHYDKNGGDSEWVDIVESELRQILEPKLHGMNINGNAGQGTGNGITGSETVSSVTPPLPPISPTASSPEGTPRNARYKHQSLPYGSKPDYNSESRAVMPNQRAGWQHTSKHRNGGSKKQDHSVQYKKHMFGIDNTDITSTTTRSLDLSSMLDGQSDSDVSTQDARAIRRQLQGLENMYCEVLKLLGVRKPPNHNLGKYQPNESRMNKRRYGSVSSLPSSSVSSRPIRDKRRNASEQRKKVNDIKGINKRFQRLESHVVTLARSVAHLSSEMRTQHLMIQEMENIRGEITALRNQQRSQSMPRMDLNFCQVNGYGGVDSSSLANPSRVKKLTKFFGDEPPLLRMFLKKLGYEKYASLLENERVGAAELPFLGEERLRALGVPLGPRLRILHEARLALPPANASHTTLCIV